ncbi:MAG TPA: carboxyl transferase domain-containing protein [Acidimicrobiales bacterium]|nr:carboxyl transferase domain-containing protein [Acidimicrobiales bacterium]
MTRLLALGTARLGGAHAEIREFDGQRIGWFRLADEPGDGDPSVGRGAIGPDEAEATARLIRLATDTGVPIVGVLATTGTDVRHDVAALVAWGHIARALVDASGVVPIALAVVGPCAAGPALLIGLADIVVFTADATAFVSGPAAVAGMTGETISRFDLGGVNVHETHSGICAFHAADEHAALDAIAGVLSFLPANNHEMPPWALSHDELDRDCEARVPDSANAGYDIRTVVDEVCDRGSWFELWTRHAPNAVVGFARVDGYPVGVVANQPAWLAGTLDIEASTKAARFVQMCDSFNVPLLTLVDTPGFQPGKDIEWRGMIRHGAKLVHAYAAATVARVCVILRKAYGGAYIVMDSRGMGSDFVVAWPSAEIAVMGASGAIGLLYGRRELPADEMERLIEAYEADYCTPRVASERGYVDMVIEPSQTRRIVVGAFEALRSKREHLPKRRHANPPQ